MLKRITFQKDTPDHIYTAFCNKCEKQGIFVSCGSPDDKWIMLKFEDNLDFLAWTIATNKDKIVEV